LISSSVRQAFDIPACLHVIILGCRCESWTEDFIRSRHHHHPALREVHLQLNTIIEEVVIALQLPVAACGGVVVTRTVVNHPTS